MAGRYSRNSGFSEVLLRNVTFSKEQIEIGFDEAIKLLKTAENISSKDFDQMTELRISALSELIKELQKYEKIMREELSEVEKR